MTGKSENVLQKMAVDGDHGDETNIIIGFHISFVFKGAESNKSVHREG